MNFLDCTVVGDVFLDVILKLKSDKVSFCSGGTSYIDFARAVLGGSGNIATGLSALGGKAAFVGKAGDDFYGKLYVQDLKRKRVVPRIFFDQDCPTGLLIALVTDGKQRSFLVFRGANDKLSKGEIDKETRLFQRSRCVYFTGYSLINDPQQSAVLRGVELARKFKTKIVFDPGAYNIVGSRRKIFLELLDLCDVLSLNLEEAQAITKAVNIEEIISRLRDKVPLTALKCGVHGCILSTAENIVKVPSLKVRALDPTGAGDAFTAALIYGLTHKLSLESTGKLANWFAAKVVASIGARGFPSKSKSDVFLKTLLETIKTDKGCHVR